MVTLNDRLKTLAPLKVWLALSVATLAGNCAAFKVPLVICEAFKFVTPAPLPLKVPERFTPAAPLVSTPTGNCAKEMAPVMF